MEGVPRAASCGRSEIHQRLVNTAIPSTAAKTICAKHACITGSQYCSNCLTTSPPKTACTATPATAITPNQRNQRRSSLSQIRIASASVKMPNPPAITRGECSKNAPPPTSLTQETHFPNHCAPPSTHTAALLEG